MKNTLKALVLVSALSGGTAVLADIQFKFNSEKEYFLTGCPGLTYIKKGSNEKNIFPCYNTSSVRISLTQGGPGCDFTVDGHAGPGCSLLEKIGGGSGTWSLNSRK
jgi:hypothetical protein